MAAAVVSVPQQQLYDKRKLDGADVYVSVGCLRVGAILVFLRVCKSVAIRVAQRAVMAGRALRIQTMGNLPSIGQTIAVAVAAGGVSGSTGFFQVGKTVKV
jgi:hypothetical protein